MCDIFDIFDLDGDKELDAIEAGLMMSVLDDEDEENGFDFDDTDED